MAYRLSLHESKIELKAQQHEPGLPELLVNLASWRCHMVE